MLGILLEHQYRTFYVTRNHPLGRKKGITIETQKHFFYQNQNQNYCSIPLVINI